MVFVSYTTHFLESVRNVILGDGSTNAPLAAQTPPLILGGAFVLATRRVPANDCTQARNIQQVAAIIYVRLDDNR